MASLMSYSLTNFSRRGKVLVRGRADGVWNTRGFEVLEFGTDVVIVVLVESDVARCGKGESGGAVLGSFGRDLVKRRHRQMHVFEVQVGRLELVDPVDEVGGVEIAERVGSDPKADGQRRVGRGRGQGRFPARDSVAGSRKVAAAASAPVLRRVRREIELGEFVIGRNGIAVVLEWQCGRVRETFSIL